MTKREIRTSDRTGNLDPGKVKATMKAAHVVAREGDWVVVKAGPHRTRKSFFSEGEARSYAQSISDPSSKEFFVHRSDGSISRERGMSMPRKGK